MGDGSLDPAPPLSADSELLVNELHLEAIRHKGQVDVLRQELSQASDLLQQKSHEVTCLAQKTLRIATELASRDSELLATQHSLSLAEAAVSQLKANFTQSQVQSMRLKTEVDGVRGELLEGQRLLRDSRARELRTKDSGAPELRAGLARSEHEKERLIALVQRLQEELVVLKRSNEEVLQWLNRGESAWTGS